MKENDWKGVSFSLREFVRRYDGSGPVVIFGTSSYGIYLMDKAEKQGISVECFTCNSAVRFGTRFNGLLVKPPPEIEGNAWYVVAIVGAAEKREVMYQLLDAGVAPERIAVPLQITGAFSSQRQREIPEFADAVRELELDTIRGDKDYFCNYFLSNDLCSIGMLVGDEMLPLVRELMKGTELKLHTLRDETDSLEGLDAILISDRERFMELEESFMLRCEKPIINFWNVR